MAETPVQTTAVPAPSGEEWRALETPMAHVGAAGNDATLAAAKANIARLRQRDVAVRLVQRDGSPLAHRVVEVTQTRHAFPFGDQTWDLDRMHRFGVGAGDRAAAWRRRFAEVFNAATTLCYWTEAPRNDGPKMEDVQGQPTLEHFAACVDWAAAEGLTVKGHPLVWSIPKAWPQWLGRYDLATQMKFLEVRVRSIVARFRGKVAIWDVVNESLWEPPPSQLQRRHWPHVAAAADIADYVAPAVRWCREEDPAAVLVLNDYGMETDDARHTPRALDGSAVTAARQRRRMLELVEELSSRGAAPDAIGLQSHTGGWIDPVTQTRGYDELSAPGLPLHVTEFWADTRGLIAAGVPEDEAAQRQQQYVLDFLTTAFGHPAVDGMFFWGFMEAAIRWHPDHSGHQTLPLFDAVRHRLREEWCTRHALTTDAQGRVDFRGFLGDYALSLDHPRFGPRAVRLTLDTHTPALLQLTF